MAEPAADALALLPGDKRAVVTELVRLLAEVTGIEAVVLGGSYARSAARPDSDVDLGLYYSEHTPPAIGEIRAIARRVAADVEPTVTELYEWGPWVNGGAWIKTVVGKVDLLYRNIEQVRRVIEDATRGQLEWHFGQQPPYGFYNFIYLGETHYCVPLHDPRGIIGVLKDSVATYPEALRNAIIQQFLWGAEFTLMQGRTYAAGGDVYGAAGCLTRCACQLTQVLFAVNETYFMTDKGALQSIDGFQRRPLAYGGRMQMMLSHPGDTPHELAATMQCLGELLADVVALVGARYVPKYRL